MFFYNNKRFIAHLADMVASIVVAGPITYLLYAGPFGQLIVSPLLTLFGLMHLVIVPTRIINGLRHSVWASSFEQVQRIVPKAQTNSRIVYREIFLLFIVFTFTLDGMLTLLAGYLILVSPTKSHEGYQLMVDRLFGVLYVDFERE